MDLFSLLITVTVVVFIAVLGLLLVFFQREINKSRHFFDGLAKRYGGRALRFPVGVVFRLEQRLEVKIYALQGSVLYRARIHLREDPGILITRIYRGFKFLDKLSYSPGRTRYEFHAPVGEHFTFQAFDGRLLREVFEPDLLEKMTTQGRVTRLEIRQNRFRGALMMMSFSANEVEKAEQSIEILNEILRRVVL